MSVNRGNRKPTVVKAVIARLSVKSLGSSPLEVTALSEPLVCKYALTPTLPPSPIFVCGAKVLGKLPVPGRPTIVITVGQGPTALAVGAGGVVWTFLISFILSFLFLPLFGRRPDID